MPMDKNNASKFSKSEPWFNYKPKPQNIAWHKPSLKVLYNAYVPLLIDSMIHTLMSNSNKATISMEPKKWIIILHNNYSLISYSISCRHITWLQKYCNCYSSKPNVARVTTVLKCLRSFIIYTAPCVTRFEKSRLPRTQQQDKLFTINNSCTCWLTVQQGIDAESFPGCFCCVLFLRLVRRIRVYGSPSNGCVSPW